MKIVQVADYLIYFDNVRVDPYIASWHTNLGLFASDASGSITMYRSKALHNWKAYLTQVRIFSKNVFTGKYTMIFEGEITNRGWGDKRIDSGKISYSIQGFYHWLDTPIPLMINNEEKWDGVQRFIYEAQNINTSAIEDFFMSKDEVSLKNKTIEQVILTLFEKLNSGYYNLAQEDSSFGWAKIKDRIKVMTDIIPEFRSSGALDLFSLMSGTQIETFYVYLNEVLNQLMFEFYQDRDGSLRIKNPSWKDNILKNHIIDESLVEDISGSDNWRDEPTRVLAIGGVNDLYERQRNQGDRFLSSAYTPMGLYIGDPRDPNHQYFSERFSKSQAQYGLGMEDVVDLDGAIITDDWFDNLTDNPSYPVTSSFQKNRTLNGKTRDHRGTDYGMKSGTTLYNIGGSGKVNRILPPAKSGGGGNVIVIDQGNVTYKYMHLSNFLVSAGDTVKPGQPIGRSGATGDVTGPHLHLEIWVNGSPVNPVEFLRQAKQKVQDEKRKNNSTATPSSGFDRTYNELKNWESVVKKHAAQMKIPEHIALAFAMKLNTKDPNLVREYRNEFNDIDFIEYGLMAVHSDWADGTKANFDKKKLLNADYNIQSALAILQMCAGAKITDANIFQALQKYRGPYRLNSNTFAQEIMDMSTWVKGKISADATGQGKDKYSPLATVDNRFTASSTFKNISELTQQGTATPKSDWMTFECTAYSANDPNSIQGTGSKTATGMYVGDHNKDYFVIAVDPKVIPLKSKVEIEGMGIFSAEDTGGAIKGKRIDILMRNKNLALQFGRRNKRVRILRWGADGEQLPNAEAVKYTPINTLRYPVPHSAKEFKDMISKGPNGIESNLIAAVISVGSGWREKFKSNTHVGLMALPVDYAESIPSFRPLEGVASIQYGTQLLSYYMGVFHSKVTLALAAYYIGDPAPVQEAVKKAGGQSFVNIREELGKNHADAVSFTQNVVESYAEALGGDYISGDLHKELGGRYGNEMTTALDGDTTIPDYETNYKPVLSREEIRFKMNLKIVEQKLIRYDSQAVNSYVDADELIYRYAQYIMQLHRAQAHNMTVQLTTCLPFLRPGFNTWIEPSRTNVVSYITGISHQGAFGRGCFTTLRTGFTRDPKDYDDLDESIFLGKMSASSKDFGPVVVKEQMDTLRNQLISLNESVDEVADDAINISVFRDLYSTPSVSTNLKYVTQWNAEYTKKEIEAKILELYQQAPSVIQERCAEIKRVMEESEEFFMKHLLFEIQDR